VLLLLLLLLAMLALAMLKDFVFAVFLPLYSRSALRSTQSALSAPWAT